ncbi:hypothetical protein D3C72_1534690 [compost metagenome]
MRPTRSRMRSGGTPRLRSGKARFSATVMVSYTTGNWNTWAMLRACGDSWLTGLPSNSTSPWDGVSSPEMMLSKVDLPQPDGPSKA